MDRRDKAEGRDKADETPRASDAASDPASTGDDVIVAIEEEVDMSFLTRGETVWLEEDAPVARSRSRSTSRSGSRSISFAEPPETVLPPMIYPASPPPPQQTSPTIPGVTPPPPPRPPSPPSLAIPTNQQDVATGPMLQDMNLPMPRAVPRRMVPESPHAPSSLDELTRFGSMRGDTDIYSTVDTASFVTITKGSSKPDLPYGVPSPAPPHILAANKAKAEAKAKGKGREKGMGKGKNAGVSGVEVEAKKPFRFSVRSIHLFGESAESTPSIDAETGTTASMSSQERKDAKRSAAAWGIRRIGAPVTTRNLGTSALTRPFFLLVFRAIALAGTLAIFWLTFTGIGNLPGAGSLPLKSFLLEATIWIHGGLVIFLTTGLCCSVLHMVHPSHEPRNARGWRMAAILFYTVLVMSGGELVRLITAAAFPSLAPPGTEEIFKFGSVHAYERYVIAGVAWIEFVISALHLDRYMMPKMPRSRVTNRILCVCLNSFLFRFYRSQTMFHFEFLTFSYL
jgi:hypothetical protein